MTPAPVHLTLRRGDVEELIYSLVWVDGVDPDHETDVSRQLRRIRAELQAALVSADASAAEPDPSHRDEPLLGRFLACGEGAG